jgi:hypothetical protein
MKEFTNERNPMHVSIVEKPLLVPSPFKDMEDSTQGRNTMSLRLVGKLSLMCPLSSSPSTIFAPVLLALDGCHLSDPDRLGLKRTATHLVRDLFHLSLEAEKKKPKKKISVQSPNSYLGTM